MSEKNVELKDDELLNIGGGLHNYEASSGYTVKVGGVEYDVVDGSWGCPCEALGHNPGVPICVHCNYYYKLENIGIDNINGWHGYCKWK